MSLDFLLEIGTEEIPHWMIPGALAQLSKLDLLGATPRVDATPRRLVVRAEGLPERTPDAEQVVKGPPITAGDKAAVIYRLESRFLGNTRRDRIVDCR
jgi:glycyl-tRNA synthetase beta subunit